MGWLWKIPNRLTVWMPSSQPEALYGEVAKAVRDGAFLGEDGLWGGDIIPDCFLAHFDMNIFVLLHLAHHAKPNLWRPGAKGNLSSLVVSVVLMWLWWCEVANTTPLSKYQSLIASFLALFTLHDTLRNFIFFIIFTTMLNFLVDLFAVFLIITHSPSEQKPHQVCVLSPALGTCQVLKNYCWSGHRAL